MPLRAKSSSAFVMSRHGKSWTSLCGSGWSSTRAWERRNERDRDAYEAWAELGRQGQALCSCVSLALWLIPAVFDDLSDLYQQVILDHRSEEHTSELQSLRH